MSIKIDANLSVLQNKLSISTQRMEMYAEKTVDQIIESEAKAGNSRAVQYARELYGNASQLVKAFSLDNPSNKLAILQEMNEKDIVELLPQIEDQGLMLGLNFFTQDKMLKLLEDAPIEEVVNMTLTVLPLNDVLDMIPSKELDKFVKNKDLDQDLVLDFMDKLAPEVLAQMIESVTGVPLEAENLDPKELTKMIAGFDKDTYQDSMVAMDSDALRSLIAMMSKKEPEVLQLFDAKNYTKSLATLQKPDMMKGTIALTPETMVEMLGELPKELMAIVATQVDAKDFAEILVKKHQDILESVIAA